MQEVRDEMTRRVAAIRRRSEWIDEQCAEHTAELVTLTHELASNNKLAAQYEQILATLPKPDRT